MNEGGSGGTGGGGGHAAERDAFILAQQRWVRLLASRYARTARRYGYELDDLVSVGMIKVVEIVNSGKYDPSKSSFETAASAWVDDSIQRELRRGGRASGQPPLGAGEGESVLSAPRTLAASVPIDEQPTMVLPTTDRWLRESAGERQQWTDSFRVTGVINSALAETLADARVDVEMEAITHVDGLQVSATIRSCLECLTENERLVIELRFVSDLKQREIGARMGGISQQRISALQNSGLRKLRAMVRQRPDGALRIAEVDGLIHLAARRRIDPRPNAMSSTGGDSGDSGDSGGAGHVAA